MTLSLSRSKKAQDTLHWGVALAMAVVAHGAAGWLLLRSQGASNSGPTARAIMIDLAGIPDPAIPARDLALTPDRDGGAADNSSVSAPGDPPVAKVQGIGSEPPAKLADETKEDAANEPVGAARVASTDMASKGATAELARDWQTMPGDSEGDARSALEKGRVQSMMGAPIDTSSAVGPGRVLNGHKGPRDVLAQKPLNEPKEFKELRELEERLFKRPISIAAWPSDQDHRNARGHQPAGVIGGGGVAMRNAIGILIEHPAMPTQIGISPAETGRQAAGTRQGAGPEPHGGGVAPGQSPSHANSTPAGGLHDSPRHQTTVAQTTVASVGGLSLNGTSVAQSGSGTGAIGGGVTKANLGAINGTSFRTKYR